MAAIKTVKLGQRVRVLPILPDEPENMFGQVVEIDEGYCDEECGYDLIIKLDDGTLIDACELMVTIIE